MVKRSIMAFEPRTRTFAGIYESQGHYSEALNIYIDLLKENPLDMELTGNIGRLQSLIIEEKESKERKIKAQVSALESFMEKTYAYKNGPV